MPVQISSSEDGSVSITIDKVDLPIVLTALAHAKFSTELKSYVLLSPPINELIRSIMSFSDENGAIDSGTRTWARTIPKSEASHPESFVSAVYAVLAQEFGDEKAGELLPDAVYPNRLEDIPGDGPSD
jgi:hypothetical protein